MHCTGNCDVHCDVEIINIVEKTHNKNSNKRNIKIMKYSDSLSIQYTRVHSGAARVAGTLQLVDSH